MTGELPSEEQQRRHWRLLWLSSIQAFADSETQKARWLDRNERNPHYSFVECMCSYFDDAYLGEDSAYQKRLERGHLSDKELAAVTCFHAAADAYHSPSGDDYEVEAILGDPRWQSVVDAARDAQKRLLALLADPTEIDALTRPLEWEEENGTFSADLVGSRIVPAGQWIEEQKGGSWLQRLFGRNRR